MNKKKLYINNALSCHKKKDHSTERSAMIAADAINRRHGTELRVYKCLFCGHWHKTKKKKKLDANHV